MHISLFEDYLQDNLLKISTFHPTYEKALQEMFIGKAKRFRPMLLLSVIDFYTPLLNKNAFDIALALEFFHTYSLIHDDLPSMDNASLRRGMPTLHTKYNDALAILVGDALNTEAFYIIAKSTFSSEVKNNLVLELSKSGGTRGMVLGQAIDLEFENKKLNLQELTTLHTNKTAKLIASSLKMGAIISDLSFSFQDKIYEMGIQLGVLFQIQDDILDATLTKAESGKDENKDINKNSFVNLLGIDKARNEADKKVQIIFDLLDEFDEKFKLHMIDKINIFLIRHK